MQVGFSTIAWGLALPEVERALDVIAAAGYRGVEFAQRPDQLGVHSVHHLLRLLEERDLAFLGMAVGRLDERLAFCEGCFPQYFYIDDWQPEAVPPVQGAYRLALHPRAFKRVRRLADAISLLERYPYLDFLPDTAHMAIVGDDPVAGVLDVAHRVGCGRIAAVHLKDWNRQFGRAIHRYARGFTPLGQGTVPLKEVVEALKKAGYAGWLVAELDLARGDAEGAVASCARWLADHGLLEPSGVARPGAHHGYGPAAGNGDATLPPGEAAGRQPGAGPSNALESPGEPSREAVQFLRAVLECADAPLPKLYQGIARACAELVPSHLVTVWACSPAQDAFALLATWPPQSPGCAPVVTLSKSLTGLAIERHTPMIFQSLDSEHAGRRFQYDEVLRRYPLESMMTLPIHDFYNVMYVPLVVNLLPIGDRLPSVPELREVVEAISSAVRGSLDRTCSSVAARVHLLAAKQERVDQFLQDLCLLIQESLECEGVSLFLVDQAQGRLRLGATTGIQWYVSEEEEYYEEGEGLTGTAWARRELILSANARAEPGYKQKSCERVATEQEYAAVWVPFLNPRGEPIAVARCRNRRAGSTALPNLFTDHDAALIDAIGGAATAHLLLLQAEEQRVRHLGRLTHELKLPLVAIRDTAGTIRRMGALPPEVKQLGEEIWHHTHRLRRLFGNADILRYWPDRVRLRVKRVQVMRDVLQPLLEEFAPILQERRLPPRTITLHGPARLRALWLDPELLRQAVFNLIDNAIQHGGRGNPALEIQITVREEADLIVTVQDNGPGLEPGTRESIFRQGVRGRHVDANIRCMGLGLWVTRRILEAHHGRAEVARSQNPTEFRLTLPGSLAEGPP